jgi:hypothetical protein
MASPQSSVASVHHLHPVGEVCPTCDQPIPHERAEEVHRRLEERARQQAADLTAALQEKFDRETIEAAERHKLETQQKLEVARAEAKAAALVAANVEIEAAKAASRLAQDALATKTAEVETARAEMAEQVTQAQRAGLAEVERVRTEAAQKLAAATAAATEAANALAAEQLRIVEADKVAAVEVSAGLQVKLEAAEKAKIDAVAQARAKVSETAQVQVAEAVAAKQAAEQQVTSAQQEVAAIKAGQEALLMEQREALEADKATALSVARSQAFTENQKLLDKVGELQRSLDKKTAEELGEGAEIDLFDTLKAEFESDRFQRVKKGQPGADIIQTVVHNGQVCGKIIYDSKNHNAWRNDFVTKLRADQMAEGAEHAILTVLKFPQGVRQLHFQDGVLVANPARVGAVVEVLRRHMIQTHTLRLSGQQRAEKTAALYDFITSDQCAGMFERLDSHTQKLLDIQVAERSAHEKVWKEQGLAIRGAQKVQAEMQNQIEAIIGTASAAEPGQ